jgi:hypothetical protein
MSDSDSFSLCLHWGPRPESREECALKVGMFIRELGGVHDLLASWVPVTRRKKKVPVRGSDSLDTLKQVLVFGVNRSELTREPIEELGLSIGLWNKKPYQIGLSARLGSYIAGVGLINSVVLGFPPVGCEEDELHDLATVRRMILPAVEIFRPEWAAMISDRQRDIGESKSGRLEIGWVTYLADPREIPADLACRTERVPSGTGSLIVLNEDRRAVTEADTMSAYDSLARTNALDPIPDSL